MFSSCNSILPEIERSQVVGIEVLGGCKGKH